MRLRLIAGRMFEPSDRAWIPGTGPVNVTVSEALARQVGGPVIGASLFFGPQAHRVVGVVGDVAQENYDSELPTIYIVANTSISLRALSCDCRQALRCRRLRSRRLSSTSTRRLSSPAFARSYHFSGAPWQLKP